MTLRETMQRIVDDHPLASEYDTDARYIWPARWAILEAAEITACAGKPPETPTLKPCPFCGEARTKAGIVGFNGEWWHVVCRACGSMTDAYCVRENAVAAWNQRA